MSAQLAGFSRRDRINDRRMSVVGRVAHPVEIRRYEISARAADSICFAKISLRRRSEGTREEQHVPANQSHSVGNRLWRAIISFLSAGMLIFFLDMVGKGSSSKR